MTAGGIDCHVHFICPQLAYEAISSGELLHFLKVLAIYMNYISYQQMLV